ncbi:MAG: DUF3309 family protein [Gammaproteobacteria bacterium]
MIRSSDQAYTDAHCRVDCRDRHAGKCAQGSRGAGGYGPSSALGTVVVLLLVLVLLGKL